MEHSGLFRNLLFAIVVGASSGLTRLYSCDNPGLVKRVEALERSQEMYHR